MNVSIAASTACGVEADLTETEFLQAVEDAAPLVAVFDFDGTLWPGDAGSGFMRWSIETGLLSAAKGKWLLERHASYHRGEVDEISICGEMVQIYGGLPEAPVRQSARLYLHERVMPNLFPSMAQLVRDLSRKGAQVWAVSSTSNLVIEQGVVELGIPANRVLAATLEKDRHLLTEALVDVPSG